MATKINQNVFGSAPVEVMQVLHKRRVSKTRDDGNKVALVLEGGALRGIYSCAVAHALAVHGYNDVFDLVIGTSSGGLNALYFESSSMEVAASIYYENAVDKRCLNFFKFPNVLNVRWLVDNYILGEKRFSDEVFSSEFAEILIPTTDKFSAKTVWGSNRDGEKHFTRFIRATAFTPLACDDVEVLGDYALSDGFVNAGLPLRKAQELGCTHAVVAPTQPWGYEKHRASFLKKLFYYLRTRDASRAYFNAILERHTSYMDATRLMQNGLSDFKTLALPPVSGSNELVGNTETSGMKVKEAWLSATKRLVHTLESI